MAQMGKSLLDWKDKEWVYEQWCNGYTQAEIADAIGCNLKTIQRFLCKKQKIKKPLVKGEKAMSEESDREYRHRWYMEHRE